MWVFIILLVVAGFVMNFFVAYELWGIAKMKGHTGARYFVYPFLFGIFGALVVVALPDWSGAQQRNAENNLPSADELPDL